MSPIGNPIGLIGNTLGAIPVGIDSTVRQVSPHPETGHSERSRQAPSASAVPTRPDADLGCRPAPGTPRARRSSRTSRPRTDDTKLVTDKDQGNVIEIEGETTDGNETPDGTKPEPFAKLRESLKFDPNKGPFGIRPNGEGPLKRIVNALTGQQPKPEAAEPAKDEAPAA